MPHEGRGESQPQEGWVRSSTTSTIRASKAYRAEPRGDNIHA